MKTKYFVLAILILVAGKAYSQYKDPSFASTNFQSFELKAGFGKLQPQLMTLDVNYQKNIARHISLISFTQVDVSAWKRNPDKNYLVTNHFHFLQTIGIGVNTGGRRFNLGLNLLGGGRYYHSKTIVRGINEPEMNVNKLFPELGIMSNIKIGKNRFYFNSQIYFPLTPFAMNFSEKNITLSIGAGYKIIRNHSSIKKRMH